MDITSTKQLEDSTQAQTSFIDIKDGEKATLRIVSGIKGVKEHNIDIQGSRRAIMCPEAMEEWEAKEEDRQINKAIKCPVCERPNMPERRVSTKFFAIAIDDKGTVGVLKKGPSVYKVITDLMGEGYDLSETPVIISRKGEKLDTEYTVLPARKDAPLTEEEKAAVEKFKEGYDIEQYAKPMSYENIVRKLNGQQPIFDENKAEDTMKLPD